MSAESQPLVTVITPVYNGQEYMAECIQSVLDQTYARWEYLIVDNCSQDRSFEIARQFAGKDERIRIVSQKRHVSAGENHQTGFREMSPHSKYCKVVHADDWLFPDCLTRMVEVAESHPAVGIVGAYRLDNLRVNLDGLPYPSTVVSGTEVCRRTLFGGFYVFGSPTSLLFRSEIVRQREPFYDEEGFPFHWDTAACFEVLRNLDFGFVHQTLTFTRRPAGSRTSFGQKLSTCQVETLDMLMKYGPFLLKPAEFNSCFHQRLKNYFRFLGRSMLHHHDRSFWNYHKRALRRLGTTPHPARMLWLLVSAVGNELLYPARAMKKGFAHFRADRNHRNSPVMNSTQR